MPYEVFAGAEQNLGDGRAVLLALAAGRGCGAAMGAQYLRAKNSEGGFDTDPINPNVHLHIGQHIGWHGLQHGCQQIAVVQVEAAGGRRAQQDFSLAFGLHLDD